MEVEEDLENKKILVISNIELDKGQSVKNLRSVLAEFDKIGVECIVLIGQFISKDNVQKLSLEH